MWHAVGKKLSKVWKLVKLEKPLLSRTLSARQLLSQFYERALMDAGLQGKQDSERSTEEEPVQETDTSANAIELREGSTYCR